jgi:hypothetical protein
LSFNAISLLSGACMSHSHIYKMSHHLRFAWVRQGRVHRFGRRVWGVFVEVPCRQPSFHCLRHGRIIPPLRPGHLSPLPEFEGSAHAIAPHSPVHEPAGGV